MTELRMQKIQQDQRLGKYIEMYWIHWIQMVLLAVRIVEYEEKLQIQK